MKNVFMAAVFALSLTPAFAFAKGISDLEGVKIACQGGALDFVVNIGHEIPSENSWETSYVALLTGPRLYQPTTVAAKSLSTRVYAGLEMVVELNEAKVSITDIFYSGNQNWMPLGLSGNLVNADGQTTQKLACQYL